MGALVVDTHTALWYLTNSVHLSSRADYPWSRATGKSGPLSSRRFGERVSPLRIA